MGTALGIRPFYDDPPEEGSWAWNRIGMATAVLKVLSQLPNGSLVVMPDYPSPYFTAALFLNELRKTRGVPTSAAEDGVVEFIEVRLPITAGEGKRLNRRRRTTTKTGRPKMKWYHVCRRTPLGRELVDELNKIAATGATGAAKD